MLPRFKFAQQLLWILVLTFGILMFGAGKAEAEEALASWYGPGFHGSPTATGEPYDAYGYTTAHKTLPMGTELIVSYQGKSILVTVNDRGPYSGDRELDLSQGAAQALGLTQAGVDYVEVQCANGGIYPNCSQGSPTIQDVITTQYDTTAQDSVTAQDGLAAQDGTTAQEGATTQDGLAAQDGVTTQEGLITPQYDTTAQESVTTQDSLAAQDGTTAQDGATGGSHVVQSGETLSGIAGELGLSLEYLITNNGIEDPDVIYSGQVLYY